MDYRERITINPDMRGGKPCIRGTRITVYDVLCYLASGMSHEEVLADFPYLEQEDIFASLAFAANIERRFIADTREINIRVDTEAAKAYTADSVEERKKLDLLMSLRLSRFVGFSGSLEQVMCETSKIARERGLTEIELSELLQNGQASLR